MSTKDSHSKKPDFGILEEDDDFEEFPAEEWGADDEDPEDKQMWKDDWDDDSIEDSFSNQLRAELESKAKDQGKKS